MDRFNLKKIIESIPDSANMYLLEAIDTFSGFFSTDGKLLYVVKDIENYQYEGIETDYLKLHTHLRINAVKNDQTFSDGFYNVIIYNGGLEDSNIDSFCQLCEVYSNNISELKFKDFFYSLITIFQLPAEQAFKNVIGLYGELKFMQYVYNRFGLDISNSWHRTGSYSKYDYSNGEESLEIKTTLSGDNEITIKHEQIFGEHPCTLVAVICEQYENGETVDELLRDMHTNTEAFNGINFSVNIVKELKRVKELDVKEIRFMLKEIRFFSSDEINPFEYVPDNIRKLTYSFDISDIDVLPEKDVTELLLRFV